MESTIQTASNQLDLSDAIQQFFNSNQVNIPTEFKQMFINNYQRRNQKFMSDELYQIFKSYGYKSRQRDFCNRFIKILKGEQFKEISGAQILGSKKDGRGGHNKQFYEVTYKGYSKIMMRIDDQIADYFIECESLLVSFFQNYVQSQQLIIRQREEQLQDIKSKSDILFIYEIDMVDRNKRYRGKTFNMQTRIFDHLHKSTNKEIREAVQNGEVINIYVLAEMRCQNKDQQAFLEQLFILNLPEEIRSNVVIPFVQKWSNVPQEFQQQARDILENHTRTPFEYVPPRQVRNATQLINMEEIKEVVIERQVQLNNSYDTINIEDYKEYIQDTDRDTDFKDKIQQVVEFKQTHNKYPKDNRNSKILNEYSLAQFMNKIKIQARSNNGTYCLSNERFAYIRYHLPDFVFINDTEADFKQQVIQLQQFIGQYNRYPNPNEKENQSELKIATFLGHLRSNYKKDKLSKDRHDFVTQTIPDFIWDVKFCGYAEALQQLQEFYNLHKRLPLQKENKHLQTIVSAVKQKKIILSDQLMSKYGQLFN